MLIREEVLGAAVQDNALLATVQTGQSQHTLLFDCGENCLDGQRVATIREIEHLFFSHFHMDHVAGFDTFFRHNYNRPGLPVHVWGPPGTRELMAHRFQGFSWNLHHDQPGEWIVHEVTGGEIQSARFCTGEAFATGHVLEPLVIEGGCLFETPAFRVEGMALPHGTIASLAYRVVTADTWRIDPEALGASGLQPGPWLETVRHPESPGDALIDIGGEQRYLGDLRESLLLPVAGSSLAYLTDFRVEPDTEDWNALVTLFAGTDVVVCECQYLDEDLELARQHGHMNASLVGKLAAAIGAERLVLHHLSRRYGSGDWERLLNQVRVQAPQASFPAAW